MTVDKISTKTNLSLCNPRWKKRKRLLKREVGKEERERSCRSYWSNINPCKAIQTVSRWVKTLKLLPRDSLRTEQLQTMRIINPNYYRILILVSYYPLNLHSHVVKIRYQKYNHNNIHKTRGDHQDSTIPKKVANLAMLKWQLRKKKWSKWQSKILWLSKKTKWLRH